MHFHRAQEREVCLHTCRVTTAVGGGCLDGTPFISCFLFYDIAAVFFLTQLGVALHAERGWAENYNNFFCQPSLPENTVGGERFW